MKIIFVKNGKESKPKELDKMPIDSLRNVWGSDGVCRCYIDVQSLPSMQNDGNIAE